MQKLLQKYDYKNVATQTHRQLHSKSTKVYCTVYAERRTVYSPLSGEDAESPSTLQYKHTEKSYPIVYVCL